MPPGLIDLSAPGPAAGAPTSYTLHTSSEEEEAAPAASTLARRPPGAATAAPRPAADVPSTTDACCTSCGEERCDHCGYCIHSDRTTFRQNFCTVCMCNDGQDEQETEVQKQQRRREQARREQAVLRVSTLGGRCVRLFRLTPRV